MKYACGILFYAGLIASVHYGLFTLVYKAGFFTW